MSLSIADGPHCVACLSSGTATILLDGMTMHTLHTFSFRGLTARAPWHLNSARSAGAAASTLLAILLSGCALSSTVNPSSTSNVVLGGLVHGGNQPVVGSHIALFATTAAGYGGTLTPLASTTTTAGGFFTISTSYTCPAGSQAYIVASGGNPGMTAGTDNSAILLMAALGPCANLTASTNIWLNEVTTVAAAYALSGFAPANNSLTETAIVNGTNVPGFTTSATNTQGLIDAFANANNIVNFSTGQAYTATPTTSANGVVPTSTINGLADILQDCVNSSGPTSTQCANLLSAATPPSGSGVAAPVNVLQAAIDIAQYPGNNTAALFNLISAQSAFPSTGLTAAPNDWTIGITYTGGQVAKALGMAIDNNDNVYVSGSTNANLAEFSPQGNVLSPAATSGQTGWISTLTTAAHNIRNIAVDQTGNLWLSDGATASVWEYTPGGSATSPTAGTLTQQLYSAAPASVATANNYNVAVDGLGDVWTTGYKKSTCSTSGTTDCELVEFVKGASTPYTPNAAFGAGSISAFSAGVGGARGLAFDVNTGNVWYTDIVENAVSLFPVTPATAGAANATAAPTVITLGTEASSPATNNYGAVSVAIDNASRAWVVVAGGAATTGTTATAAVPAGIYPVNSTGLLGTPVMGGGLSGPAYLAIDGNNNLFVANATPNAVVEYSPGFNSNAGAFLSPNVGFSPGATYSGSALSGGTVFAPGYVSVDRSGALWVLSSGTGTSPSLANIVQILGVAAPTNPVLAAGRYGLKP